MKFSVSTVSTLVACGALALLGLASPARAHFYLVSPPANAAQDNGGDPQKAKPCGGGANNNMVTTVKAGEMLKVSWRETTYHPGHYRISLANNTADFVDPVVMGANCGSAAIQATPMMPVLADGVNAKTTRTNLMYETMVKIPENFTCERCTLQVIQFMSQHGAPCFYYHCANLKVTAAGAGTGGTGGGDGGVPDSSGTGGIGGAGGMGGSTGGSGGSGGSTGGAGGSTGGAGGSTGGSGGSTGGSGGSTGGSGGSTGGSGSGGSGSSRGGSSGSGTGGTGSGTGGSAGGGDSGGCSIGGDQPSVAMLGFVGLMFGLALRSRRRRR